MNAKLIMAAIVVTCSLAACAPQIAVMKNPRTGEIVQCGSGASNSAMVNRSVATDCAAGYAADGWIVLNAPKAAF